MAKTSVKTVPSTDGWAKKQPLGEKKADFQPLFHVFLEYCMVRCGQEQRKQIEKALGILLMEDLIYGNDNWKKNRAA